MPPAQGAIQASPDFLTPSATPPIANVVASVAQVAALAAAGTPVAKGTLLVDPVTRLIYGQSNGMGGMWPIAAIVGYTAAQLSALAAAGGLTPYATYIASDSQASYTAKNAFTLVPTSVVETTSYVTLTASGVAFTGACELAGWYCSVAAGAITIYDALSVTGTPIVPATALAVGPMPIFGAGTNGKLALLTGCYVVLSGAATVRMLVQ